MPEELPDAASRSAQTHGLPARRSWWATRMTARRAAWSTGDLGLRPGRPVLPGRLHLRHRRRLLAAVRRRLPPDHGRRGRATSAPRRSSPARCPTSCADSNPCTEDRLISAGTCARSACHLPITALRPGDGCCPPTPAATPCSIPTACPSCGNGVVEQPGRDAATSGERAARVRPRRPVRRNALHARTSCGGPPRPATPPASPMPITGVRVAVTAAARPAAPPPTTATAQPICGNGVVDTGETCDRAITAGTRAPALSTCDDGNACTVDIASGSAAGCTRTCVHQPRHRLPRRRRLLPARLPGARPTATARRSCGDGRIGAGETCDPPSTCPTTCPDDGDPCTRRAADRRRRRAATSTCRHVPITTCSGAAARRLLPHRLHARERLRTAEAAISGNFGPPELDSGRKDRRRYRTGIPTGRE